MIDFHRAASRLPYPMCSYYPALPSCREAVSYASEASAAYRIPVETIICGNDDDTTVTGVMVMLEERSAYAGAKQHYYCYREIPADGNYKSAEQLEDEMTELFNDVVEAVLRDKDIKSIADYYGLHD